MDVDRAARILREGGIVAFPTETVYGLGAHAFNVPAVERVFRVKGRPSTSPLIVHVASKDRVHNVVAEWPEAAERLADVFWPGPLTLVLPKLTEVPDIVTAGLSTVGIRVPAHPVAQRLLEAAEIPVAAPSANRFTEVSPTTAAHVRESLGNEIDMILDGGATNVGIESTVISLAGALPVLLRPGMIRIDELEAVIGPITRVAGSATGAHASPGMHRKHYSPKTKVIIGRPVQGAACGYLWHREPMAAARSVQMPAEPEGYGRRLYAVLRELDKEDLDLIVIEPLPDSPGWLPIQDRIARAATSDPNE